jgi:hypothetical protein
MSQAETVPRVLANWKPVRFGRSRLQRHMSYEIMRPMETTTRTRVLQEPREVNSLYVMWYEVGITPSQRRRRWKDF